ncbi:MAG: hypothetical protein HQL69_08415 [Magnetococcales bacterium]|nr:hypothetical protein [Magnetococcales bacterium]
MKLSQYILFAIFTFFSFTNTALAVCVYGDCKSGYGESITHTGTHYRGEFVDGVRTGSGTLTWPDGSNYDGFFKENKFNGLGTFVWEDGTKYIGYWKNGLQHGEGEKTLPSGTSIYGKFKFGKLKKVVFIMEPGEKEEVASQLQNSSDKSDDASGDDNPATKDVLETKVEPQEKAPLTDMDNSTVVGLNSNADVVDEEPLVANWVVGPTVESDPAENKVVAETIDVAPVNEPLDEIIVANATVEDEGFDLFALQQNKIIILISLFLAVVFMLLIVKSLLFNKNRRAG